MTYARDEVIAMDEDALNRAITGVLTEPRVFVVDGHVQLGYKVSLTLDFANDIRAAYELEAQLPENLHPLYSANLIHLMADASGEIYVNDWWCIHASAADRCRAWLLTMGDTTS